MNIKTEKSLVEEGPPNCKILKGKKKCVYCGGDIRIVGKKCLPSQFRTCHYPDIFTSEKKMPGEYIVGTTP